MPAKKKTVPKKKKSTVNKTSTRGRSTTKHARSRSKSRSPASSMSRSRSRSRSRSHSRSRSRSPAIDYSCKISKSYEDCKEPLPCPKEAPIIKCRSCGKSFKPTNCKIYISKVNSRTHKSTPYIKTKCPECHKPITRWVTRKYANMSDCIRCTTRKKKA